jgi:hypothetical protein
MPTNIPEERIPRNTDMCPHILQYSETSQCSLMDVINVSGEPAALIFTVSNDAHGVPSPSQQSRHSRP